MSVLFADMVGYTATLEKLGEERSLEFVQAIYASLARCVREHDGRVHAFGGDSVMAVFGLSEASENAALQACRAAMSIQKTFAEATNTINDEFNIQAQMRVGISSGVAAVAPVDSESMAITTIGNAVNLASRIESRAPPGGCLICEATRGLIEWQVELELHCETMIKGVSKPQKLWRLVSVRDNATRFHRSLGRGLSPLVGRDENLAVLADALERSRSELCVVDLAAEPGLGKTRLTFEFLEHVPPDGVRVLQGHCAADSQPIPFLPFIEVVRGAFQIGLDDEPAAIAKKLEIGLRTLSLDALENRGLLLNLLGLAPPAGALTGLDVVLIGLRTRDLLFKLLKARCSMTPVLLLLEDIHWIDSASEEVLAAIVASSGIANLLVVHTRRPEYHPPWAEAPCVIAQTLTPLTGEEILRVARDRLGVSDLPEPLIRQVVERAGGNPLFSEEILSFLIEQGAVRIDDGEAVFDSAACETALPTSLLGLLAARLDRLMPSERGVLQAAAVVGRRFDAGLLALARPEVDHLGDALKALQKQDFIDGDSAATNYSFKHVLMRDCVYHGLLPADRTKLHLAVAEALEVRSHGRLTEVAELLALHYAQTACDDRAFTFLAMAGAKSLGTFSHDQAAEYFASALALYESNPRCASEAEVAVMLANYALCLNLSLSVKPMLALADRVEPLLARIGDSPHHALFLHHYAACLICNARYRDALAVQQRLSAMAGRLNDRQATAYALVSELSVSTYCAPMPIERFDATSREAARALSDLDDAYLKNFTLASIGWDQVCRGQVDRALETADRLVANGTALNDPRALGYGTAMRALIASIADDYEQALELAERALDMSRARFEQIIASAARCGAIVPLARPNALEVVQSHLDLCRRNGWTMFEAGPELMLGVAQVTNGQIGAGLARIEAAIVRNEQLGFHVSADWGRLYLCEVYLAVLSGKGGASASILLRNAWTLGKVFLQGPSRILSLIAQVRANPQLDPEGHNIGRAEMVVGLLHAARRKPDLARHHLSEAKRLIQASGASPLLDRIDGALSALAA
ncbi:AAA family ATPase [Sphingomonas sp. KRR8]|uniref:ATP-binding protein n=1 Tax=Sphingomonas sp. KRR8 TaxID=2942996 RepID=UPI0020205675|nr:adenylate/guanylate cyclase domain-containing protein [Sphingomonas sp. KRR8]URD60657.1 AAA family ATPase [Sphingomonas sp. KRR8]